MLDPADNILDKSFWWSLEKPKSAGVSCGPREVVDPIN